MSPKEILRFWFQECSPEQWFQKSADFDRLIESRFLGIHRQAAAGELFQWRDSAEGRLAEILILDQFSRNLFRDDPRAFASDDMALALAQEALRGKHHLDLSVTQRAFLYMPFMHSESSAIHEIAMKLFSEPGMETNLRFEILHFDIIKKFGRYPHRNQILGRKSTPDEIEFLKQDGSSF